MKNEQSSRKISPEGKVVPNPIPDDSIAHMGMKDVRKFPIDHPVQEFLPEFKELHPADQAEVFTELTSDKQETLIKQLAPDEAARVFEYLEPAQIASVIEEFEKTMVSHILDQATPDVAADILKQLPEKEVAQVLQGMKDSDDVLRLLIHPDETAGGLMTTDLPVVRETITAGNALDLLRIRPELVEDIGAMLVANEGGSLVGILGITQLALARPTALVSDIMVKEVPSIYVSKDREEAARIIEKYNLKFLAVVGDMNKLLGIILVEDVVDVLEEEATEDMYKISGMGGEKLSGSLANSVVKRLPWLYINLGTTLLAALVISLFEGTLSKLVTLAVFLPVVAGQGGIAGTQTLTLVVRSIALDEIPPGRGFKILTREIALGVIHGIALGIIVGVLSWIWKGNPILGLVVGLAMTVNIFVAGLTGAAIPLILKRLKMDPAVSSAVFVTTVTDILGFILLLGIASLLINSLI
jgi:magnesium transporter